MKKFRFLAIAALAIGLAACAGAPDQPPDVAKIQAACAADALIRPSVSALLAVPGVATSEQIGAVMAARAVIDPICADPAAARQGAVAGLAAATGQVVAIYAEVKAKRQAAAAAEAASAPK